MDGARGGGVVCEVLYIDDDYSGRDCWSRDCHERREFCFKITHRAEETVSAVAIIDGLVGACNVKPFTFPAFRQHPEVETREIETFVSMDASILLRSSWTYSPPVDSI